MTVVETGTSENQEDADLEAANEEELLEVTFA